MTDALEPGLRARLRFEVTDADTAEALGSGSLPVLATPRLLVWCEQATCTAIESALPAGRTSVGSTVELRHTSPTAVGEKVYVEAVLEDVVERNLVFIVDVIDAQRRPVADATILRVVVDVDRFMGRIDRMR